MTARKRGADQARHVDTGSRESPRWTLPEDHRQLKPETQQAAPRGTGRVDMTMCPVRRAEVGKSSTGTTDGRQDD